MMKTSLPDDVAPGKHRLEQIVAWNDYLVARILQSELVNLEGTSVIDSKITLKP